jgi:general secretion pathway protein G
MNLPTYQRPQLRSQRAGFTLLEIMLVVAIIGLLLAAAVKFMGPQLGIARDVRVKSDINSLTESLRLYNAMNGFYPTTDQGLQALVTKPDTDPRPTQWKQYMEQLPLDAWQMPYQYECPGKHNPNSFDIYSCGPTRKPDAPDIIGNWDEGK